MSTAIASRAVLKRHAHYHSSSLYLPTTSLAPVHQNEPYAMLSTGVDQNYYARYRDPVAHDECSAEIRRKSNEAVRQPQSLKGKERLQTSAETIRQSELNREVLDKSWQGQTVDSMSSILSGKARSTEKDTAQRPMAALFSGSGSQFLCMGSFMLSATNENYTSAQRTWDEAEDALEGFEEWRRNLHLPSEPSLQSLDLANWAPWQKERPADSLKKIVFGGSQRLLMKSSNAQPAILITSIAFLRTLEKEYGVPISKMASYFAGHSSGEIAALVASEAITFREGVWLSRLHGLLTSRTLMTSNLEPFLNHDTPPEHRAQMSALVINSDYTHEDLTREIELMREEHRDSPLGKLEIASYNSSSQIVLAGSRLAVFTACAALNDKGMAYRAADLPCWSAFHTKSQAPAAKGMEIALSHSSIQVKTPSKPVLSCLSGEIMNTPSEIKSALVAQISQSVRWSSALQNLRERLGITEYVYLGPSRALPNLAKREVERGCWGSKEYHIMPASTESDLKAIKQYYCGN